MTSLVAALGAAPPSLYFKSLNYSILNCFLLDTIPENLDTALVNISPKSLVTAPGPFDAHPDLLSLLGLFENITEILSNFFHVLFPANFLIWEYSRILGAGDSFAMK